MGQDTYQTAPSDFNQNDDLGSASLDVSTDDRNYGRGRTYALAGGGLVDGIRMKSLTRTFDGTCGNPAFAGGSVDQRFLLRGKLSDRIPRGLP
jgi:hypothetical protein